MGEQGQDWRDREPFEHKRYKDFYQIAGGGFITLVILLIGGFVYSNPQSGYWVNIYATLVGTVLTIAVLDRRAEHRAIRERKEELILQMGSTDKGFAVEAARLLRQKQWLYDGSLIRANLSQANLQGSWLQNANLQGVDLSGAILRDVHWDDADLKKAILDLVVMEKAVLVRANLQDVRMVMCHAEKAVLSGTNLERAALIHCDLEQAVLLGANLRRSRLDYSNLEGVFLCETELQGANMFEVNLKGAILHSELEPYLEGPRFDTSSILPDGSHWTPSRDIREFTDPNYPNFWRSNNPSSPAYRGNAT